MRRTAWLVIGLSCITACGPGTPAGPTIDGNPGAADAAPPGTPVLTAGGGVTGGPIAGALHVYVVAAGGATPIAGAAVRVGAADDPAPHTGTTDATGLVTFTDAGLTGAQSITATATGKTAVTWIGANATDVTIPLEPSPRATPTAHAAGSITGWDSLPQPSLTHYTLGVVLYSFLANVGAPENHLTQPTSGGAPLDTCVTSVNGSTCAWQLVTRTGPQVHVAAIVDGNTQGTASDTSDDTYTLIGYAAGAATSLTPGQQQTNEQLTMVPANALTSLAVTFPAAPAGLGHLVAIPMLDLGANGKIVFPLPTVAPGHTSTKVIAASGAFAGTYDLVALATPSATTNTPYSSVFATGINLANTAIDPFLPAPRALSTTGGTYAFTASTGASLHYATFTRPDQSVAWNVTILDGTTSFKLPALSPDPLGTGARTLAVTAADITGFDAAHFAVGDLTAHLHRAAGATAAFTH
jgi:hypothetical protein